MRHIPLLLLVGSCLLNTATAQAFGYQVRFPPGVMCNDDAVAYQVLSSQSGHCVAVDGVNSFKFTCTDGDAGAGTFTWAPGNTECGGDGAVTVTFDGDYADDAASCKEDGEDGKPYLGYTCKKPDLPGDWMYHVQSTAGDCTTDEVGPSADLKRLIKAGSCFQDGDKYLKVECEVGGFVFDETCNADCTTCTASDVVEPFTCSLSEGVHYSRGCLALDLFDPASTGLKGADDDHDDHDDDHDEGSDEDEDHLCEGVSACLDEVGLPTDCDEVLAKKSDACGCFQKGDCVAMWEDEVASWNQEEALKDCDFGACTAPDSSAAGRATFASVVCSAAAAVGAIGLFFS